MLVAASTVLMLVVPAALPGCRSDQLEVDKAALYTPESLASELAFRYQALNGDAKNSTRKPLSRSDKAAAEKRERGTKSQTKSWRWRQEGGEGTHDDRRCARGHRHQAGHDQGRLPARGLPQDDRDDFQGQLAHG